MSSYIDSLLDTHFSKTIWSNPIGRINHYFKLIQFGRFNGELSKGSIYKYTFYLPDDVNHYHLFQMGGLKMGNVNLSIDTSEKWYRLDKLAIDKRNTLEFITDSGLFYPLEYGYVMRLKNNAVIIALRALESIENLSNSSINLRVTQNHYISPNNPRTLDFDAGVYNSNDLTEYQDARNKYETCKGDIGYTFVHFNGLYYSKPDPSIIPVDGDVFSAWYDSSIKGFVDVKLNETYGFRSLLDNVRKVLVHPKSFDHIKYNYWGNCNFILGYVKSNGVFVGVEIINDTGDKIRMVTDRSWSIPTGFLQTYVDKCPIFRDMSLESLTLRIFYRQNDEVLEYENTSHLKLLYSSELLKKYIAGILTGGLNGPDFWVCDKLEIAPFMKIMRAHDESLTQDLYLNALDYYSYRGLLFADIKRKASDNKVSVYINDYFYNFYKPTGFTFISSGSRSQWAFANGFDYTVEGDAVGHEVQIHTSLIIEPMYTNGVGKLSLTKDNTTYTTYCPDYVLYKGKPVADHEPAILSSQYGFTTMIKSKFEDGQLKDIHTENKTTYNNNDVYRFRNSEKHVYYKPGRTGIWEKLPVKTDKISFYDTPDANGLMYKTNLTSDPNDKLVVRQGNTGRFFYYGFNNNFNGDAIVISAHEGFSKPYDVPFDRVSIYAGEFDLRSNEEKVVASGAKLIEGIDYVVKWPYIYISTIDKLKHVNTIEGTDCFDYTLDVTDSEYDAVLTKIRGLAIILEGAVDSSMVNKPNDNYGFITTIENKNYFQVKKYQSAIQTCSDININVNGQISSVTKYIGDINNVIFTKTGKAFLAISDNIDDNLKAGTPIEIINGMTDYYENNTLITADFKKRADNDDVQILDLISNLTPTEDMVSDKDVVINRWYAVYSVFMARLLTAIEEKAITLDRSRIKDKLYIESLVKPYLAYFEADICHDEYISPFIIVYPTSRNSIIQVDETTFYFITMINDTYLNNAIDVKRCVVIKKG